MWQLQGSTVICAVGPHSMAEMCGLGGLGCDGPFSEEAAPASVMSVDAAWDLKETHEPAWARNRDSLLHDMKNKLAHGSPLQYLESKYPTSDAREGYARALWQMLPPQGDDPPFLDGDVPGKYPSHVSAKDARVVHVATLAFSETSMVCLPNIERCMKLADEILTDGFVTDTEPRMLNVSMTDIELEARAAPGIPPWGDTSNGKRSLRPFSLCHHKSAARVITLHLLLNCFLEEPQQCFWC